MRARERRPDFVGPYANLVPTQIARGRLVEAESSLALLSRRFGASRQGNHWGYMVHVARRDYDGAAETLRHDRQQLDASGWVVATRTLVTLERARGRLDAAEALMAEWRTSDRARARPSLRDALIAARADVVLRGRTTRGLARLDAALARHPVRAVPPDSQPDYLHAATTYALAGHPGRARAVLARYEADADATVRHGNEWLRRGTLGEIALAERRWTDAAAQFRASDRAPDGGAPNECTVCLPLALARVHDGAGQRDSAIVAYERFLATPSPSRQNIDVWFLPLAYRRLARLHEARGDRVRAAVHWGQLAALWAGADADLQPAVAKARAEHARLTGR